MPVQEDSRLAVPENERRHVPRRQAAQHTICRLFSANGDWRADGLVWNISRTGVSILLGYEFIVGTALKVELIGAGGRAHLRASMRVVHCTKIRTGDYALGGQFDIKLEEDQLALFLA
jgi:hypothetical protein